MSKILKVILEFDDKTMSLEGADAEKWKSEVDTLTVLAHNHTWKTKDLNWKIEAKEKED